MIEALRRMRDEEGETHVFAVVRIGLGLLWLHEALYASRSLAEGFFRDRYFWPALPLALLPGRSLFAALVALRLPLALLTLVGWRARPALLASALIELYTLLADRLAFHNYRYTLALFTLLLALAPCTNELVLLRKRGARPSGLPAQESSEGSLNRLVGAQQAEPAQGQLLWTRSLAQIQVALMYLASGGSKLLDPDWRQGRVISDGITRFRGVALARGAPSWALDFLARPEVSATLAHGAIGSELFLAVGLLVPRLRALALWWGVWFHLLIQGTTSVAIFTWLMLLVYALFALPATGERQLIFDPTRRRDRALRLFVRAIDWLARFTARPRAGAAFTVVDRDGRRRVGAGALAGIARATPILFPAWLPLEVVARLARSSNAD